MLFGLFTLCRKPELRLATRTRGRREHGHFRPRMQTLEDRYLPATLTVFTKADNGVGSLRAAITTADFDATPDTIVFAPNLAGQTITLGSALPDIDAPGLTITGPGASSLTVNGNQAVTVFTIGAGIQNVTISGLTISGGMTGSSGGGILNYGQLTLNGVTVTGNTANISGGGIESGGRSSQLTILSCLVSNNSANNGAGIANGSTATVTGSTITGNTGLKGGNGAGIDNDGTMTIRGSTISSNTGTGTNFYGGGIENESLGTLVLAASTVVGNSSDGSGGGIHNDGASLTITNSTIANNSALAEAGGGIRNNSGSLTINDSTITGNTDQSGMAENAGGISLGSGGTCTLNNTIVAQNSATGGVVSTPDIFGVVTTGSGNFIGIGTATLTGISDGSNGNHIGTSTAPLDPHLGPLQDNGGPTVTRAPLTGSPVLGAGVNAAVPVGLTTDQRGFKRFVGPAVDVGAVEVQLVSLFAVGGAPGYVLVFRPDNSLLADFQPLGPAYTGGVSVAVAAVRGDGYDDLIVGATAGNPDVRVYDGKALATGTFNPADPNASLLAQFFAYGLNFNVGANVAAGDIEHTGYADIVTGASAGNLHVKVFRGKDIAQGKFDPNGSSLVAQWFPYALQLNVGANVAVGDVNGDGFADVVAGATAGNPDVRVYSGQDLANGTFDPAGKSLLAQFFAYGLNFNVGAFVAVGDTTGSGFGDVITGASAGNPDVHVYSGQAIANHSFDNSHPEASLRDQFFAYGLNFDIGAAVASADFENTGRFDILTGASAGAPHYRVVKGGATGVQPPALFEGVPADLQGGIAVGA
jgi:hypothetical protein